MTEAQAEQRAAYARESEKFYAAMLKRDDEAAATRAQKRHPSGFKHLTPAQRMEIKRLRANGARVVDIAERFGVNPSTIYSAAGKR